MPPSWKKARDVRAANQAKARQESYQAGFESKPTPEDALCVGLYWGEGSKDGLWIASNSEIAVISQLVRWAVRAGQHPTAFKALIQVHPEDETLEEDIKTYWSQTGIPSENISVYWIRSKASKRKSTRRTPFGTCSLRPIKNQVHLFQFYLGQKDALS